MKISMQWILRITGTYIMVPIVLFLFWWTHWAIAILISVGTIYLLMAQTRQFKKEYLMVSPKTVGILSIVFTIWTLLSGAGHRGAFNGDYFKHNAVFNDLISLSWPVQYRLKESGDVLYLVYYFAYYLPSALIGKWGGWEAGNIALFVWTLIGVVLVMSWLLAFVNEKKQLWYGLLFPLFSGLDGIGKLIMGRKIVNTEWEWWGRNWQYSGNTTLFFYVPQHAIIGWLMMGMVAYSLIKNKRFPMQILLLCASLLWSPFVFIGLLPFYVFLLLMGQLKISKIELIMSGCIVIILYLFFSSNLTLLIQETASNGWLWETERLLGSMTLVRLSLFYILEFVLYGAFIFVFLFKHQRRTEFIFFFIGFALLILFPWYKMGLMNDFTMRSSIPALYVVCYYWLRTLIEQKKPQEMAVFIVLLFVIGSLYPIILLSNGIKHFSYSSSRYTLNALETPKVRRQYLGRASGPLFRLFNTSYNSGIIGDITLQK